MKAAVVTGASSGLGREFVLQLGYFYKNLDEIWVFARRKERLEQLRLQSRVRIRIFAVDLNKKKTFHIYRKALEEHHPDIRILVNAAGFGKSGGFDGISKADRKIQPSMIDLNCRALTRMIQETLPYMGKGSRIINIASAAAFCPQFHFAVYAATKSYVLSLSRALGAELKHDGIYVTAVCPGPVDTEFFNISGDVSGSLKKKFMADASHVVHKALKDCRKRKPVSVYGPDMKVIRLLGSLIPHSIILKAEEILFR